MRHMSILLAFICFINYILSNTVQHSHAGMLLSGSTYHLDFLDYGLWVIEPL